MKIERFPVPSGSSGDGPPYSRAVRCNGFVFVSGQVGVSDDGALVVGGIIPEAHQTIGNVKRVLASLGLGLEHVVKVMVWLADPSDYDAFNAVYREHFGTALPARACVRSELMGPYRVEVEVLAAEA